MKKEQALLITKRIKKLSADVNHSEIYDLTTYLEEILSQPGISSSSLTKSNTEHPISYMMAKLIRDCEMSAQDILLLAKSQGAKIENIGELTQDQWQKVYDEATDLHNENLLYSYLSHLLAQEEKHTLS